MKIDAREVSLIFDSEKSGMTVAVDNIDITIHPGEMIGIIGPSGSGKSSLLYLLSGLKPATSGSVFYDEKDICQFGEQKMTDIRQNKFGFIFQRHYLIEYLSLIQNILTPLKKPVNEDLDFADFLMQELGIYKLKDKYPNEVSVGERQKAAVIRAIIHKPEIIFADEPTASMDIDSAMNAMSLLESYDETAGLMIVTHDYKILSGTDKIYHMRDGRFM